MNDYYDGFDYFGDSPAVAGTAIIGALLIVLLFAFAISIAMYLFRAIGLYRMGKRLNLPASFLAFIPVANVYFMGRIAQEPVYGKKKLPYGWILLGLTLCINLVSFSSLFGTVRAIIQFGEGANVEEIFRIFMLSYMTKSFLTVIASVVYTVFYYIALYNLYKNFDPDNATLLLVLSVIFGFLTPIFIFACRNKPIGGTNAGGFGGYYGGGYIPNYNQNPNQGCNPNVYQGNSGGYDPAYGAQGFPPYNNPANPEAAPQQPPVNPDGQ